MIHSCEVLTIESDPLSFNVEYESVTSFETTHFKSMLLQLKRILTTKQNNIKWEITGKGVISITGCGGFDLTATNSIYPKTHNL